MVTLSPSSLESTNIISVHASGQNPHQHQLCLHDILHTETHPLVPHIQLGGLGKQKSGTVWLWGHICRVIAANNKCWLT